MGVEGMGTTFIQTVDISELDIKYGGRTNYSIKVDKQDSQDRIYMHITGKDGSTNVFSGTDILSESGVASGYQTYESGFDFAGTITSLTIEIGGRDVNLSIGPLFDSVSVNVLYNTISTIVTQTITSVEMWVAYGGSTETEVIDIVETVFDNNIVTEQPGGEINIQPIDEPDTEVSYETVEMEMKIEIPEMKMETPEVEMASVETDIEAEMEMEMEMPEPEEVQNETVSEDVEEPQEEVAEEPKAEESTPETSKDEVKETVEEPQEEVEEKEQPKEEPKKQGSKKEVAAKKILKKMGDKGRYDSANQLKTLIVMQVLGNSKSFFDNQQSLNDIQGFFTGNVIPDAELTTNNIAQYFLFAGSDGLMDEMIMQQWQMGSE
jgi:hypothetical protein